MFMENAFCLVRPSVIQTGEKGPEISYPGTGKSDSRTGGKTGLWLHFTASLLADPEVNRLLAGERRQLLRERLPPQELFARMEGTRFLWRRCGPGMFETRTLLSEAGIPDGDACQRVVSTDAICTLNQVSYPVTPGWFFGMIAVCWMAGDMIGTAANKGWFCKDQ